MKTRLFTIFLLIAIISPLAAGGTKESARSNEVVVYANDSFCSDWGAGPEICRLFEEQTGYKVTLVSVGSAAQVLSKAILEKNKPQSDVLLGIDNLLYPRAVAADVFTDWTPYDWSTFAVMWDSESSVPAPKSLADLTDPVYRKKIILEDPRMSTVGIGFLAWTIAIFGDGYTDYWRALKPNILTLAPSWDTGYGLFTAGEAPLTVSYTTSAAYHVCYDNTDRYKALEFDGGYVEQTEGAALTKGALNEAGGRAFLEFLTGVTAQAVIPETQWMYPANSAVVLPESYKAAPVPAQIMEIDPEILDAAAETVLSILAE